MRLALFNVQELSAEKLGAGDDPQVLAVAEILRRISPDVVVLQEIDQPQEGPPDALARELVDRYLAPLAPALAYPHVFVAATNTGMLSGQDLNRDGRVATAADRGTHEHGEDSFGFGVYPGQYSMAVLSRLPIDVGRARTFQRFLWRDLPGHHIPPGFYGSELEAILRLSSKSHWDLPLLLSEPGDLEPLHLLVSHPTPPVFDGDEDRNGRRNFDEIRFWALYLDGDDSLYDDKGQRGGLRQDRAFVIVGDLNARPNQVESLYDDRTAVSQVLDHTRVQDPAAAGQPCTSRGALAGRSPGPPDYRERATAEFLGGVQVDYLLPSAGFEVVACSVFWPSADEDPEGAALAEAASDHRLVFLDLRLTRP
ncbi:MAG TPA: endonuclease/exonuclease/phosphatase family protein [Thermoanaerobaculia bacterium]|nr:endonuclease/exonuclease/phosphatase family protein [Thermoanaerobaculia bacterium]